MNCALPVLFEQRTFASFTSINAVDVQETILTTHQQIRLFLYAVYIKYAQY